MRKREGGSRRGAGEKGLASSVLQDGIEAVERDQQGELKII